jgi:hypothetical protein
VPCTSTQRSAGGHAPMTDYLTVRPESGNPCQWCKLHARSRHLKRLSHKAF